MKRALATISAIVIGGFSPTTVMAQVATASPGPFGLAMGMSVAQVREFAGFKAMETPGMYSIDRPPRAHSDFESYELVLAPKAGLCMVTAVGTDISSDSYGVEVRDAFVSVETALTKKYGAAEKRYDFLKAGSVLKDANDWMMGLQQEERVFQTLWIDTTPAKFPDKIQGINLQALALSRTKGYLRLRYEFANAGPCLEEVKALKKSSL
jgi:hypothetical protein